MNSDRAVEQSGTGLINFTVLMAVVLITLRLLHLIDWPWWLILTCPIWIFATGFIAITAAIVVLTILNLIWRTATRPRRPDSPDQ